MAKYSQISSFNALQSFSIGSKTYQIFSLAQAQPQQGDLSQLPKSVNLFNTATRA